MREELAGEFPYVIVAVVFVCVVMGTCACVCACLHASPAAVSLSLLPPFPIHAQHDINKPASGHVMA